MLVRANGSPYIVCEMARYLVENGFVVDDTESGSFALSADQPVQRQLSAFVQASDLAELPTAEHRVLLSKMDRLPPAEQRLLRTCAVLALSDESFTVTDVEELQKLVIADNLMSAQETDDPLLSSGGDYFGVYSQLMALEKRQMLALADDGIGGSSAGAGSSDVEISFSFRKPVVREVAYATMTYTQRQQIHAIAAKWMMRRRAEALRTEAAFVARELEVPLDSITSLASDVWDQLDFARLARHWGHADNFWASAKAWQDAGEIAISASLFEEALVFVAAGIKALCNAQERAPADALLLAPTERPSHNLLWLLLGLSLHHLGFTADAYAAFADLALPGQEGGEGRVSKRRVSSDRSHQRSVEKEREQAALRVSKESLGELDDPELLLSGRTKRFSIRSIGNGQLAYTHIAEGARNNGALHRSPPNIFNSGSSEADKEKLTPKSRSRSATRNKTFRKSADALTQLRYFFAPPLSKPAKAADASTLSLHKRLIVQDALTMEVVALLHVAAGSIGGATAHTAMADAELAARANSLAARVEKCKRYDLSPFCAALVTHTGVWQTTMSKLLHRYEAVARPLLDSDGDEFDLEVPLDPAAAPNRRAAAPVISLCRLCATHLFGLAYLRVGDVVLGRIFEEAALEDAIRDRSMQLCHSTCLSLAFILWEQGGLLEAGHLFLYVLSVTADLADANGTRYMKGCISCTVAMLARDGKVGLWAHARALAGAARIPAIEAFVLLRSPERSAADLEQVLVLLDQEARAPTEFCWFNFMIIFCYISSLLELMRRGAELLPAERLKVYRRAKEAVDGLKKLAEAWAALKPRALLFEAEFDALTNLGGAAQLAYTAAIRLAIDSELDLIRAQALAGLALTCVKARQERLLEAASGAFEMLELHADAADCEERLRKLGAAHKEPAGADEADKHFGALEQMLRRARTTGGDGGGVAGVTASRTRGASAEDLKVGERESSFASANSQVTSQSPVDEPVSAAASRAVGNSGASWIKDHILLIAQTHTSDVSAARMAEVIHDLSRARRQVDESTNIGLTKRIRSMKDVHDGGHSSTTPMSSRFASEPGRMINSRSSGQSPSGHALTVDTPPIPRRHNSLSANREEADRRHLAGRAAQDHGGVHKGRAGSSFRIGRPDPALSPHASLRSTSRARSPREGEPLPAGYGRGSDSPARRPSITLRPSISPGAGVHALAHRQMRRSSGVEDVTSTFG
mmetsp:Transcript_16720/g.42714  ORF Transcript_16720/g.42714 Transcript_16720/m.42714 type:complete len:1212 (-) Transcript_16720:77-3712(-)